MLIRQYSFEQLYKGSSPIPVINFNKKLAVFFSAKSGCTFVVKWFFNQIDHLTAALDFNPAIHEYRWNVYVKSDQFLKSQNNFINNNGEGYLKIKVVRNPFERAVSSYMHFLHLLEKEHVAIKNNFGIGYDKMNYSFSEFLELLKNINIDQCDIHWRQQFQPINQKLEFDHIIHLKNSKQELLNLEQAYNLKRTLDIDKMAFSDHHSILKNKVDDEFCGDKVFSSDIKKNRPPYKCFYNNKLEERVRTIYALDFEKYKFNLEYRTIFNKLQF